MKLPTLRYETLQGIQPGTDEFGVAVTQMLMDFAMRTIDKAVLTAAVAHDRKIIDTPICDRMGLVQMIHQELLKQNEDLAGMWMKAWEQMFPVVAGLWLDQALGAHLTDDNRGLWIDLDEVKKAMEA